MTPGQQGQRNKRHPPGEEHRWVLLLTQPSSCHHRRPLGSTLLARPQQDCGSPRSGCWSAETKRVDMATRYRCSEPGRVLKEAASNTSEIQTTEAANNPHVTLPISFDTRQQEQQQLEAEGRRRGKHLVYEQILATRVWSDETETFCCVEPCSKESTSECQRPVALEKRRRQP